MGLKPFWSCTCNFNRLLFHEMTIWVVHGINYFIISISHKYFSCLFYWKVFLNSCNRNISFITKKINQVKVFFNQINSNEMPLSVNRMKDKVKSWNWNWNWEIGEWLLDPINFSIVSKMTHKNHKNVKMKSKTSENISPYD